MQLSRDVTSLSHVTYTKRKMFGYAIQPISYIVIAPPRTQKVKKKTVWIRLKSWPVKSTSMNKRFTCKTSKVKTVVTRDIIPGVSMPRSKRVHTVFIVPVIWLLCRPESKTGKFFIRPHERALHATIIQTQPWSVTIVLVLYVNIFLLVMYSHKIGVHCRAVWLSDQPWGACGAC